MDNSNGETNRYPVRLDFGTKISLMAALMHDPTNHMPFDVAVDSALRLQEIVDTKVRSIKAQSGRLPKGIRR